MEGKRYEAEPKIRFDNYNTVWEQRKLSELGEIMTGSTPSTSHTEYYSEDGIPWVTPTDINSNLIDGTPKKLSAEGEKVGRVVPANTVLVTCIASIGKNALLTTKGSFNQQINSLTPSDDNDAYFLLTESELWSNKMKQQASAGTMQIVNKKEFSEITTMVPNKEEQSKIGNYFKALDHAITLHQRKCDELKELKKYMLQNMFPKKGSNKPVIRFEGFTDAWEQRKLSDVLQIATRPNGNQYTKEDVLSVSDEYGCVNQIRFQGRSFAGNDISKYKIVKTGDIIYTRSPLQAKPYGIIKVVEEETGIVSPLYIVNEATEGNDAEFIYRVFDTPAKTNNYLSPLVRKGAKNTMNISNDEWLSGNIVVAPTYEEQRKIGEYFDQLDNAIALHQRKLEKLQNIKKSLLDKMFI